MTKISTIFVAAFFLLALNDVSVAQDYSISVSAGGFDRQETIVSFSFPDSIATGVYRMEAENGDPVWVQVNGNEGAFILDDLEAGASRTYRLTAEPMDAEPVITSVIDENTILFQADGHDIITYYHGDNDLPEGYDKVYRRGGYIHPVMTPGGTVLSNHLNPEVHTHQNGIWSAWTSTEFQGRTPDFWNVHLNSGRVDQTAGLDAEWEGPVHAGFKARHHFSDVSAVLPVVALNEEWEVTIYSPLEDDSYYVFDLELIQSANTAQPLVLPEYHYGGVGFRGHPDWDDLDLSLFLTSDGLGRDGNETRPKWVHFGGYTDGELGGLATLNHPSNFRFPQPIRIHPNEPYFNYAPQQLGEMSIEPGSPYKARYRYITYDGEPEPDEIERMWNDYAYPPGVTVIRE